MYAAYFKRPLDFILSLLALVVLSPVLLILAIAGAIVMGGNPFFVQARPGKKDKNGQEKIFNLIKFRSMNNRKDEDGNLLTDEQRLTKYGRFIRSTSLDELPELINILKGDMSIVGPRPLLVRDMVFMTPEQRNRHNIRQGLTGLAQTCGRNAISWDSKLAMDLEYTCNITFLGDVTIIFDTIKQVIFNQKGLKDCKVDEVEITDDFGDYLLKQGRVTREEYDKKQAEAKDLLVV